MERFRFKDYLIDYLDYYHISKKDFASRIGISQKHLIDILSGKCDIAPWIIISISLITDIPIEYILNIEANYKLEVSIDDYLKKQSISISKFLNKFNYKELENRNYVKYTDSHDKYEVLKDILKFLRVTSPEKIYLLDKNALYKSKNDKPELLYLWLERCYRMTLEQNIREYKKENIDKLVNFILNEAMNNVFNEERLVKKFNECGVYLVIEDDLSGSKIRGAFKVHQNKPAIYLTRKHKRIADIYFALLHEIAHLKSDFNKAKGVNLVSFDNSNEDIELKADNCAYNYMVDNNYYNSICKNNYDINKEKKYPKSFIVYRLAHDKIISYNSSMYQKYNVLIDRNY